MPGRCLGSRATVHCNSRSRHTVYREFSSILQYQDSVVRLSGCHPPSHPVALAADRKYFPLTIYINKPLLFNKQRKLSVVEFKQKTDFSTYLIDTGESAKTNPLISVFMNQFAPDGKINDTAFEYIRLTDKCIQHLLSNNYNDFLNSLRALSYFQLINMYNLIPQNMYQVWKEGLESESIFMKLCGSGGGGYLIAFASDKNKALKFIKNNNLRYIPVNISDSNTNN